MKRVNVKKFSALHAALVQERSQLQERLAAITAALQQTPAAPVAAVPAAAEKPAGARRGRRKRARNEMSLKEAVSKVVASKSLTKHEIMAAVEGIGYTFSARNPMNSLNTLLYTPGNFKKHPGGKWGSARK